MLEKQLLLPRNLLLVWMMYLFFKVRLICLIGIALMIWFSFMLVSWIFRQLIIVLKNLRRKYGFKAVEPHMRKALVERKEIFSDYFKSEFVTFQDKNGNAFEQTMVYCHDVCGFIEDLAVLRDKSVVELRDKVGLDSGQGQLLMTLTLYDPDNLLNIKEQVRATRKSGPGVKFKYSRHNHNYEINIVN